MRACSGPLLESEDLHCESFAEALSLFFESDKDWEYRFSASSRFRPWGGLAHSAKLYGNLQRLQR